MKNNDVDVLNLLNTKAPTKIKCSKCGNEKSTERNFYKSSKIEYAMFGYRCPYCKDCLKDMVLVNGLVNKDKFKECLEILDKPYFEDMYQNALRDKSDTFGGYLKALNLVKNSAELTWKDSDMNSSKRTKEKKRAMSTPVDISDIELSKLIDKWGEGYQSEELIAFEKKYQQLKNNYQEKTAMHTEALLTYIRYRVKEEIATAEGSVKDAKEWGSMADKAGSNAKINPSQLSKSDLTDGLNTFGELVRAVEQAVDIIPILPQFKAQPQDSVDFTLWCYVNYVRDLKGLPPCEYEDLYKFYDVRKEEYKKHKGEDNIFADEDGDE